MTGWAVAAGLTGAYSEANLKDRSLSRAASTAAKAWALAVPVRLLLLSQCCTMLLDHPVSIHVDGSYAPQQIDGDLFHLCASSSSTGVSGVICNLFLLVQIALVLRSAQRGYIPDKSFVIVSFLATGVLLIGWRSALAVATQVAIALLLCLILTLDCFVRQAVSNPIIHTKFGFILPCP